MNTDLIHIDSANLGFPLFGLMVEEMPISKYHPSRFGIMFNHLTDLISVHTLLCVHILLTDFGALFCSSKAQIVSVNSEY